MNAQIEKPNKRRNLLRWQENRLRRLDGLLHNYALRLGEAQCSWHFKRILNRRHQLANTIQIAWSKQSKLKKH